MRAGQLEVGRNMAQYRKFSLVSILCAVEMLGTMTGVVSDVRAAECGFDDWLVYQDVPLYKDDRTGAYFYVTSWEAVDADGAPNAYHPDDVDKPCGSSGMGLDCPSNAGYPNTSWWPSVLVRDPENPAVAYVQDSGPTEGFFVSRTALFDDTRSERDPKRYVDSRTVPYLVFPRPFYRMRGTGKLGDLGIAYHLGTNQMTPFIVADIGPDQPLGEASIALFEALGGANINPRDGHGVVRGDVLYVVFPYSVGDRVASWPLANEQMSQAADDRLSRLGGISAVMDCMD